VGLDELGGGQHVQVEGERGAGEAEVAGNLAGGKAERSEADEEAENVQAGVLGESGEGIDGV